LAALVFAPRHSTVEQTIVNTVQSCDEEENFYYEDMLFINGRSITELRDEWKKKNPHYELYYDPDKAMGQMIRDALTDGKSMVTMARMSLDANGEMRFNHKEIKVDLDALNKIDREQTHYNPIRRFLNWVGIWKIQRFSTNAERDARQAKVKNSSKFQNTLRAHEKKVLDTYNNVDPKKVETKPLKQQFPKITHGENTVEKQTEVKLLDNSSLREPIINIVLDKTEKDIPIEQPKEIGDKQLTNTHLMK
jgi:hypothetical protein